jgi:hypothetical protein
MDFNTQKETVETINKTIRITRLISSVIVCLVIIGAGVLMWIAMPIAPVGLFLSIGGVVFLALTIIVFVRQSRRPTAAKDAAINKTTFANFTMDSVVYAAPKGTSPVISASHGAVRAWLAPAMPSGITKVGVLGQAALTRQENTLLLTDDAIVGLQIPPTQQSTGSSIIGSILSALPTEADTKNMLTSSFDRGSLRETVAAEIAANSVETLMQKYYSFSVPYSEITAVEFHRIGGIHVMTQTLGTFQWLSGYGEDEKFMTAMRTVGLPVRLT